MNLEEPYKRKFEYYTLLLDGQFDQAKKVKIKILPKRLFRFQPPKINRFSTVQNRQLFLNSASNFDDPFDSIGNYYNIATLAKQQNISIANMNQRINQLNKERQEALSVCFCEDIHNLPLWAFYTENYKGFAIEYDFFDEPNNRLLDQIFPILYGPIKPNITNLLLELEKRFINNTAYNDIILKMFAISLLKHNSWGFQDEWRMIGTEKIVTNVHPKAIYIGYKSSNYTQSRLRNIANKIGCKCYLMKTTDIEEKEFSLSFDIL